MKPSRRPVRPFVGATSIVEFTRFLLQFLPYIYLSLFVEAS